LALRRILAVFLIFPDNSANPDISRKFFLSIWIFKKSDWVDDEQPSVGLRTWMQLSIDSFMHRTLNSDSVVCWTPPMTVQQVPYNPG